MKHLNKRKIFLVLFLIALWGGRQIVISEAQIAEQMKDEQDVRSVFSLTIDDVSRLALLNNFDIQLAEFDFRIAKTKKGVTASIFDTYLNAKLQYQNDQSKSASTFMGTKTIDRDYNIGLMRKTPVGATWSIDVDNNRHWTNSSFTTLNPSHESSVGVKLEQELGRNFFGVQDRRSVKLTLKDIEKSGYLSYDKIENVLSSVQKSFWDFVLALERLRIAKGMEGQAEKLYQLHKDKFQDGLVEAPELYASEANVKKRQNDVLIAGNNVSLKQNLLLLNLNIENEDVQILPEESLTLTSGTVSRTEAMQHAFSSRFDYKMARADIESKNIKLAMKKNAKWPEVNLTVSFAKNGIGEHLNQSFQHVSDENNPNFLAGLAVQIPLEQSKENAELQAAELEKAKSILELKLLERKIMIAISDNVNTVNMLLEKAKNSEEIARLQEKKFNEEQQRFMTGRSNTDTVIRYQEDLLQAKWDAATDVFEYQAALVELNRSEGRLLYDYGKEFLKL